MSEPIILANQEPPRLDPSKIGISYSGGGPLVLVELGIAEAFVARGIRPAVIAGASAGALAGAAHALDVVGGTGIEMAKRLLVDHVSDQTLGLKKSQILWRLLKRRQHLESLGDNAAIGPLIRDALSRPPFNMHDVRIGDFGGPRPKLLILATNRLDGTSVVFPDSSPLEDALIASSAIPGVFPWKRATVDNKELLLVDGGVVTNQPLSRLVDEACGQIFVCAVGYAGGLVPAPTNAVDNLIESIYLMAHQCTKLEEAYVKLWVGNGGIVYPHIHPPIDLPANTYRFDAAVVEAVTNESKRLTLAWFDEQGIGGAAPGN